MPIEVRYGNGAGALTSQLGTIVGKPNGVAALDVNSRILTSQLPTNVVIQGTDGKISASMLPSNAVLLDTNGKLPTSSMPTSAVVTGTDGKLSLDYFPTTIPLIGTNGKLSTSVIPDGVGGGTSATTLTVDITNWASGTWTAPSGVTIAKDYSDSSIRITHNLAKNPTTWTGLNKENDPYIAIVPTSSMNMQVGTNSNYVIITNVANFNKFSITLTF